jgi:hypothetical protein
MRKEMLKNSSYVLSTANLESMGCFEIVGMLKIASDLSIPL